MSTRTSNLWRLASLTLFCVTCATGADTDDAWTRRFSDDFERGELGPDWQVLEGTWRIADGRLVGRGTILCTRRLPGSQRVRYQAMAQQDEPGDLSAFLSAGPSGLKSGAFFGFGSEGNQRSKLTLDGREVARSDATIKRGVWHDIVCARDGVQLRQTIDDKPSITHRNGGSPIVRSWREGVLLVEERVELSGPEHVYVGLYSHAGGAFDDVHVFTRSDAAEGLPPAEAPQEIVGETIDATGNTVLLTKQRRGEGAGNLLSNPGFERTRQGTWDQPDDWLERRHSRGDSVTVVSGAAAHWGRRHLRLQAPGDGPIQIHHTPASRLMLVPGRTYAVRVWARTDGGPATLFVEPGHGRATLTDLWTEYGFTYRHPADALPGLGLYVAVQGGPAAIDDVSLVPHDRTWSVPPEWRPETWELAAAPVDRRWPAPDGGEPWSVRVPITLAEVMGHDAEDYVVGLRLGRLLPAYGYEWLGPKRLMIVEGDTGRQVPSVVVNDDRYPHHTAPDFLLFRATCPARTQRTYFACLKDPRAPVGRHPAADAVPATYTSGGAYAYRLYADVGRPQRCMTASCTVNGRQLRIRVVDRAGRRPTVHLRAPGGQSGVPIDLQPDGDDPFTLGTALDADAAPGPDGIWEVHATAPAAEGAPTTARAAFARGAVLWAGGNVRRIDPTGPPVFGADAGVRVDAARREQESFQVALDTTRALERVGLSITDLAGPGGAILPSSAVRIERVEPLLITNPRQGSAAGWHSDVILPWRAVSIPAGGRRVAWITITVPADAKPGLYRARVMARAADGAQVTLPVELAVHAFTLPARLSFTPLLGADPWGPYYRDPSNVRQTNPSGEHGAYGCFDREAARVLAHHLATNHCTPWYYYQETSPYPSPWHYDPATDTARFDFTVFDREAAALLEAGARYLFVGERLMANWRKAGSIGDWQDQALSWSSWKSRPTRHRHQLDTPEGKAMLRAWGRGMAAHLAERGWLDRAYVYMVDEAKSEVARAATAEAAAVLRQLPAPLRTWGASYCHSWLPFHEHMSAMYSSGLASGTVLERFKDNGTAYWGTYNRPSVVGYPLAIARLIGPQSHLFGVDHYMIWSSWRTVGGWVNAHAYLHAAPNAGYPAGTFVVGRRWYYGLGTLNMPWPAGEPLPEGRVRAFAATIRFAALRESAEDHELLAALSGRAALPDADEGLRGRVAQLVGALRSLLNDAIRANYVKDERVTTHAIYDVDERAYQAWRREMLETLAGGG